MEKSAISEKFPAPSPEGSGSPVQAKSTVPFDTQAPETWLLDVRESIMGATVSIRMSLRNTASEKFPTLSTAINSNPETPSGKEGESEICRPTSWPLSS